MLKWNLFNLRLFYNIFFNLTWWNAIDNIDWIDWTGWIKIIFNCFVFLNWLWIIFGNFLFLKVNIFVRFGILQDIWIFNFWFDYFWRIFLQNWGIHFTLMASSLGFVILSLTVLIIWREIIFTAFKSLI